MTFFTAGTERVTIQDGGNMGVGDTDPGAHFVVGDDTTRGYADGTGDVYVQNDLEVDGDITTGGTIKSDTDSTDTLGLTGTRFLNTFTDTLTGNVIDLDSASTAGNEIQISDDQDDGLSIKINGGSDLMVFDTSNTGESLSITPNTSIAGTLDVTGATTIAGATTVTNVTSSTNTSSGAVVVTGGAGIGENLNVGGTTTIAGITTINDTTTSSSTSTGALVIAGGVGIAEDLYIDDNIDFTEGAHSIGAGIGANTLTLGGDTSTVVVEGDLRVDGTATVENTFDLDVINKVINVNIEGDTISSAGAGLIVKGGTAGEEIVGYMKVAADNSDLEFKASTGNILTLDIDADSTVLVTNDAMLNQDVRTSANPQFDGGILIDTNTLYVNAATDRVGINTLDPVSALEIDGTDALRIPAGTDAERPTTTRQGQIRYNTDSEGFEGYSGTAWGTLGGSIDIDKDTQIQVEESADEDMIRFDTAGAERMIIDNTGNIGINTSLPEDKFQIQGDLIPGAEFIAALDPGNLDILSSSQPEFDDSFIGKQIIIPDVDDLTRIIVAVLDVDIIQVGTPLPFPVAFEDNLPFFHSEMEFLVEADGDTFVNGDLTVTGILGLSGNTTIDGDLEVTGTSTLNNVKITTDSISGEIDNSLNIKTEETGGGGAQDRITITKSGYVGVGDTTPAAHLVIGDDTNATVAGVGDVYIQNNLEVDGTITTSGNIVSDTDSTDTLGLTGTRFANTFTDTLTGNVIDLDGATAVNEIQITNGVADGLSITDGDTDFMVFTTTDGSEALSVNGNVDMNDTTESTSTNTGALVVDGGAGIAKDVNIGGSLDIAGGILLNIVKKTTDYTATLDDYVVLCDSTTADVAITLPLASSTEGLELTLKKIDSSTNACSVLPNGAELIDGSNSSISFYTQYTSYTVISDGTEWWVK